MSELALKALYYSAHPAASELAETLTLSVPVMQEVLALLTRDGLCEIIAGEGQGPATFRYRLTAKGLERVSVAFERNAYVGPAPVPLKDYVAQVKRQSTGGSGFTANVVRQALSRLVLSDSTRSRIGRAIFSGRPTLIYGPSGNGKTTITHLLGQALAGYIAVPYALEVYGHIVRLFDPSKHERFDYEEQAGDLRRRRHDRRWAIVRRPAVMAGGELTRQGLELVLDERSKVYEASLQMKANGGILVIDDFGRQQIPAVELLNRWIVALEGGVDHLSLHTGQTIEVPFDVIPFFSTNLPPEALADEAFLRRIRYKVEIPDPTPDEFRMIFAGVCMECQIQPREGAVDYLLQRWYEPQQRKLRGCHPRDLIEAVIDAARYEGKGAAAVTPEALDEVCHTYFLSE
ncbi:MAG: ATP-binding protein [Dehalococcoidia bacterium]|jgi:predicted ATPase with chaperone activity